MMMLIVPKKYLFKKHIIIAKIVTLCVMAGLAALVIWGLILITDEGRLIGFLPIAIAAVISLIQIVFGIILYNRNH